MMSFCLNSIKISWKMDCYEKSRNIVIITLAAFIVTFFVKKGVNEWSGKMENRIKVLEKAIKEYRVSRLATMRSRTLEYVNALIPAFQKVLNTLIKEQLQRSLEDAGTKIKHLYLCRLHTSDYTDSYGALMGMSNSDMYLDENLSQAIWSLSPLYACLDKDMESVTRLLRQSFIRIEESELFAMKQRLSDDNWIVAESCFRTLAQNNFNLISDSKLRLEDEVLILCGDYMDNLKIIDTRENVTDKNASGLCT